MSLPNAQPQWASHFSSLHAYWLDAGPNKGASINYVRKNFGIFNPTQPISTVGTQSLAILQDGLIVAKNYTTDILNLLFMSGLP